MTFATQTTQTTTNNNAALTAALNQINQQRLILNQNTSALYQQNSQMMNLMNQLIINMANRQQPATNLYVVGANGSTSSALPINGRNVYVVGGNGGWNLGNTGNTGWSTTPSWGWSGAPSWTGGWSVAPNLCNC